MVDVPYHTHVFDIPTASEGEIRTGVESGKAITPDKLFPVLAEKANKATTLAGYGITDAATKQQGQKADTAVQPAQVSAVGFSGRYADLLNKPNLGDASTMNVGTTVGTVAAGDDARIVGAVQKVTTVTAGAGLAGGGALATNIALALSTTSLASLALANTAVQPARKLSAGAGLTGGGDLSADRTVALNAASITSLGKADTAVQPARKLSAGAGLSGGGDFSADRTVALNAASISSLAKADSAVQPPDLGALAKKDKITTTDISATGSTSSGALLTQAGVWVDPSGGGDMFRQTYDPKNKAADAFDMGNMTETTAAKIMTAAERTAIAANTGARHTHTNKAVLDETTASYLAAEKSKLASIPSDADKTTLQNVTSAMSVAPLGAIEETNDRLFVLINGEPSKRLGWSTVKTWIKGWISKADVGLTNVDNTSDAAKPISTATQNALNGKLNTNGKAADSSLLNGQTAAQLPVSNATTTALNAKFDKSGGTITDNVTLSKGGAPLTLNSLAARANTTAGSSNTGGFLSSQIGVDIIASFYAFEQVGSHSQATISLSPGGGSPNTFLTFRGNGSLQVPGALSKGSGTFLIDHPLDPLNKNLRHGFVEAPEYLNIYRGAVDLEMGRMAVDIDAAFGMADGTFAALNVEVSAFVQTQYGPEKSG